MPLARPLKPPVLETERLILRLPNLDDARPAVEYFRENQAFLQPWYPTFSPDFFSEASWRSRIHATIEEFQAGRSIRFLIFHKSNLRRICGVSNYTSITEFPQYACQLGYSLCEALQGQGLITEALKVGLEHMFTYRGIHRVSANYMPRNDRSGAVLRKLGFVTEGYARNYLLIDEQWEDHVLTSLTNQNWKK